MTVLDTSGVVDFLIGEEASGEVEDLLRREGPVAAPDLLVFEVIAVFRRQMRLRSIEADRASSAIADLGDFPLEVFPSLPLRARAWELRDNFAAADALFVALAERIDEPFATKDRKLASAAKRFTGIKVVELVSGPGGPGHG